MHTACHQSNRYFKGHLDETSAEVFSATFLLEQFMTAGVGDEGISVPLNTTSQGNCKAARPLELAGNSVPKEASVDCQLCVSDVRCFGRR